LEAQRTLRLYGAKAREKDKKTSKRLEVLRNVCKVLMSARLAGYTAMGCSSIALVMVSLFVPALWDKINSITIDLHKMITMWCAVINGKSFSVFQSKPPSLCLFY
ncbi:hypothetical protein TELCIR_15980, partial [Teladorsagia circumcincta]